MFLRNIHKAITPLLVLLTLCYPASAQTGPIAFPGAEGAGKFTTGGRGTATTPTTVFEVTSLADDGSAGTLRYALSASATYRTVVFRVSGTIHLTAKLNIRANTTLAGQTAPGDGICVADYPVVISGDNVIIRYMRFRMGDRYQNKGMVDGAGSDDALGGLGVSNVIVDHCSVSWSTDEALTIYRGDNLTIQWSFITEPLNYSYHFESGDTDFEHHGYGGIWGAKRGSMHHNLIADCRNRNPRFAGISTYTPNTVGVENVDFRNNVIYNWGINTVYGGEGGNYNVVNNYYKYGPSTSSGVRYRVATPSKTTTLPYGKWYIDGNYVYGSSSVTADNWSGVQPDGGAVDIPLVKATSPVDVGASINTQSPTDAYESVLSRAGCSLPNRDTLDQRIVNDVRNGTGRLIDVQGGYLHGTPYEQTVNAWPTLNSTTPPVDSDHDGMPDSWETANGLNPANAADRNTYDVSGYTMLEKYLNSLSSASSTVDVSGSMTSFTQAVGTPSATQTYTVSAANLTGNLTVTPPAAYEISANGTTWYTSTLPLVLTPVGGSVASTTITVRLNATATGNYAGQIDHTNSGTSKVVVPVAGIALQPAVAVTSALTAFSQTLGTPSAVQSYTVEGNSLMGSIRITPPANYQVSADGKVWFTNANSLVLEPMGRTVAATRIYVRLNADQAGTFAGVITHTSTAQAVVSVSVEGRMHPMLSICPNPATSMLNVYHPKGSGTYGLRILSITEMSVASYPTSAGSNLTTLNVSGLPAGVYYLEFLQGSNRILLPFVRQ